MRRAYNFTVDIARIETISSGVCRWHATDRGLGDHYAHFFASTRLPMLVRPIEVNE
jgi:hypothetical protein